MRQRWIHDEPEADAAARERRRIASVLHDDVVQTLTLTLIRLGLAIERCEDPSLAEELEATRALVGDAIHNARTLMWGVDAGPRRGLGEALAELVAHFAATTPLRFSFARGGLARPLNADLERVLVRATQELLRNVVRHAGARRVRVKLGYSRSQVTIAVRDDGDGLDLARVHRERDDGGGFGLCSIREQLAEYGGVMRLAGSRRGGVRVLLTVTAGGDH